ncbi:hypothetical protein [Mesorhizobium sp.]|uniref:hypothetical protein n=1 Tax=Mesorhizobium sp. TaxID=1871066 RepID=UPI0025D0E9F7|nr:hypothetical protein [Mesorhizobium sp.]
MITRYGPELAATASQINRLTATLEEVAVKVTLLIALSSKVAPLESASAAGKA